MFMYRTAKNVFPQKYNLYLYFAGMFVTPCLSQPKQEAQLSKRGRAMLHVIEYFAKSLMVTRSTLEMAPFDTSHIRVPVGVS